MAASLVGPMTPGSHACEGGGGAEFPLQVEPGLHYPPHREGEQFNMHDDAGWSLIADLEEEEEKEEEEAYLYLEGRKARGFNAALVNLLEHRFSRNAPANAYGGD